MFGKKKCKECKGSENLVKTVHGHFCGTACRDAWQDKNLKPFQKAISNGVDKWAR
jgi:hypothetical protein